MNYLGTLGTSLESLVCFFFYFFYFDYFYRMFVRRSHFVFWRRLRGLNSDDPEWLAGSYFFFEARSIGGV